MTNPNDAELNTDLTTEEGRQNAMRIIRQEEFNRFLELLDQVIFQIKDDMLRENIEGAVTRTRIINAE